MFKLAVSIIAGADGLHDAAYGLAFAGNAPVQVVTESEGAVVSAESAQAADAVGADIPSVDSGLVVVSDLGNAVLAVITVGRRFAALPSFDSTRFYAIPVAAG